MQNLPEDQQRFRGGLLRLSVSSAENNDEMEQNSCQPAMDVQYEREIILHSFSHWDLGLLVTVTHPSLS